MCMLIAARVLMLNRYPLAEAQVDAPQARLSGRAQDCDIANVVRLVTSGQSIDVSGRHVEIREWVIKAALGQTYLSAKITDQLRH